MGQRHVRISGMGATRMSLHLVRLGPRGALRTAAARHRTRAALARTPGLVRARFVGTSDLLALTPGRVGLLCAWADDASLDAFLDDGRLLGALTAGARASATLRLEPVRTSGTWDGLAVEASGPPLAPDEPVLAFVGATLVPRQAGRFYVENARIIRWARGLPGYLGGMGIHETPVRFASLSHWRSLAELQAFAYRPGVHQPIVRLAQDTPLATGFFAARLRSLGPDPLLL